MPLPLNRDLAFNNAKKLARDNGEMEIYESLVIQYTNPDGEWGQNNIKDLIKLFNMSGQTKEQIYNILYNMGIEKEVAYAAIEEYTPEPQKNITEMDVKEQLNFTNQLYTLIDEMKSLTKNDSENYNIQNVIRVCESYINTNKEDYTSSALAKIGNRTISNLNKYDFMSPVKECIVDMEKNLYENVMGVEVDSVHSELSNSNQSSMYEDAINKLEILRGMDESKIRSNITGELKGFSTWVPRVHNLLEKANVLLDDNQKPKTELTLSEKFDLKGKIKNILEKTKDIHSDNSKMVVSSIRNICESYLKELYSGSLVSEANVSVNLMNSLKQYEWLDSIKESITEINNFLQENYMSFEVNNVLNNINKTNDSAFYETAVKKLTEIKALSESEIRESLKYSMDSLTWIPEIKYLIKKCNLLEGNISDDKNANITRKYSPVLEHEGLTYFYLSGNVYAIKENKIQTIDPKTMGALFLTLISVTENFKFNSDSIKYYKNNNTIEYKLNESGPIFKFNNKEIEVSEPNDIRNFLLNNGSMRINETSELDMIVKAFENIDNFTELDFVDSIDSKFKKGLTTNVIRLGENIYINHVDTEMRINKIVEAESATKAIELVKEYVNYDISSSLVDLLEGEQKEVAIKEAKKNSLFDRIQFLNEKRSYLNSLNLKNPEIKEADNILIEEVSKYQTELNNLSK